MSGNSYTNVFSGNSVVPAHPNYLAVEFWTTIAFVWPMESGEGVPGLASVIDLTPGTPGLFVVLPPAPEGSLGAQTIMTNTGLYSFNVYDSRGQSVTNLAPTQSWLLVLVSNTAGAGVPLPESPDEFNQEYMAWFATLPTVLPSEPGFPWNNSGQVNVS